MKSRVFPNGFIFTEDEVNKNYFPDYYKNKKILNKYQYFYDKFSKSKVYETEEQFIIIHGLYTHIDLEKGNITEKSPQILLEQFFNKKDDFLDSLNFLGGRFVIIIGDMNSYSVYPDASAMRTVFYSSERKAIGSHIKMLNDIFNFSLDFIYKITPNSLKSWDNTQFKNVRSINPNFYYNSELNDTMRFFPRKNNPNLQISLEQRLENFEYLWKEQLNFFKDEYESIIFSITGGSDSRVSLALAKDHINNMKFFTYAPTSATTSSYSSFSKSLAKDKAIVDQILDVVPLNHNFLLFREDNIPLTESDNEILNKNTISSHGRYLLPHYNYYFPEFSTLHIRGNLFEIGRAYFIKSNSRNDKSEVIKLSSAMLLKTLKENKRRNTIESHIEEKVKKFNYDVNNFDYHVLDLYYWEIRMGRWMAEVLNETDLSFETLLPFNMRELMDISLSFNIEERKNNFMFNELINRNYPVLNFFGKNDERNLYEQFKEKNNIEKPIINYFEVFDLNNQKIRDITNSAGNIYIPAKDMGPKNYSETKFKFETLKGNAKLVLHGRYKNSKAKDYLKYQILVNGELKLEEDMAMWNQITDLVITGLYKDDIIQVRVLSNKKSNTLSWQQASVMKFIDYKESAFKEELPLKVYSNSPFAIVK